MGVSAWVHKYIYDVSHFVFCNAFCGQTIHPTEKVSEGTNTNMPARNTLV